jgi:hypothetical protein
MRCPATVTLAECFRARLSDDHLGRHFRIIWTQLAIINMASCKESDCMIVAAPPKDKSVDDPPFRYVESVAVICPDSIGSAAELGLHNSVVVQ